MTTMTALNASTIRNAEFVRLTTSTDVYTFCNSVVPITINGITFAGLGSLLQISDIQRDMKATSDDLTISLNGIESSNIALILSSNIKGSLLEVWRGFLDADYQLITTPTQQFFKRYQGLVNSVGISENWNQEMRSRIATCTLASASFRQILENRVAGLKTTPTVWKQAHPSDVSFDRVPVITAIYFDFGAPPQTATQSSDLSGGAVAGYNNDTYFR